MEKRNEYYLANYRYVPFRDLRKAEKWPLQVPFRDRQVPFRDLFKSHFETYSVPFRDLSLIIAKCKVEGARSFYHTGGINGAQG